MNWVTWASVPILIFGLWLYTAQISKSFPTLQGKRVCLLIAHPDDEAMFFAPAILALTRPELGNHLKILCLSSGNADGLGEIRKKELIKSGIQLGLRSEDDILVMEDPNFLDSMNVTWNPRLISNLLTSAFAPKMASVPSTNAPQATIDVLVTFDPHGISSHPNHKSLYTGAHAFLKALMHRHSGWECPIKLYTLTTTNILRKYMSVMDAPATIIGSLVRKKELGNFPTPLLYVSGPGGFRTAQRAMTTAHKSQMRWFRWGWISIGRYMVVNDLKKEKTL
ncbi:phosphatidylinositol glycan class L [Glonium stellatum]|uniref:N-acetylglucosaminylphosphatidylinositol deacetylase n=1 Tax=Glonium stellatum TaxID=574774 RepID=A0A8E2EUA7_9PEZI|nr:phosphatidylinositol glycan class L [Glonium stellatum]